MKYINTIILTLYFICPVFHNRADAFDMSLGTAMGYDDNVPKISEGKGSGFCLYQLNISQPLNINSFNMELSAQGAYNDYFRLEDNYFINPGAQITFPLYNKQVIPGIFSDVLLFRDNYLNQDSKNEVSAGFFSQWLVSAYLTLGIRQTWQWSDYKEPLEMQMSEQEHGNQGKMGKNSGQPLKQDFAGSRDDNISKSALQGIYYFSPDIEAEFLFEHIRLNSSSIIESYKQNKISGFLIKNIEDRWEFSIIGSVGILDYESVPGRDDRQDTAWNAGVAAAYFLKSLEFRFQYEWEYNDSDEYNESFHKQVTQCGLIWSF